MLLPTVGKFWRGRTLVIRTDNNGRNNNIIVANNNKKNGDLLLLFLNAEYVINPRSKTIGPLPFRRSPLL